MSRPMPSRNHRGIQIFKNYRVPFLFTVLIYITLAIMYLQSVYELTAAEPARHISSNSIGYGADVELNSNRTFDPYSQFNSSKLALIIEGRPIPHLVPQILYMISVIPRDWRFMFIGTHKSVLSVSRSLATQHHQANGKLSLVILREPWKIDSEEDVYRLLTDVKFYDLFMPEVEWLLKFGIDSIMCGNSNDSLEDWLHYSWAGAGRRPRDSSINRGGLSIRRMSVVRQILSLKTRYNNTEPEDAWFDKHIAAIPGATVATFARGKQFSAEQAWHDKPMGYHAINGGVDLTDDVWKNSSRRKTIFEYCPELAMIMDMKLERERCSDED